MLSACCKKDVIVAGSGEGTNYWICSECKEPCGVTQAWTVSYVPPKPSWIMSLIRRILDTF